MRRKDMLVFVRKKERKKERKKDILTSCNVLLERRTFTKKERKKDILTSFKRPKWPIRPNKRLHLKCFLVFENTSK